MADRQWQWGTCRCNACVRALGLQPVTTVVSSPQSNEIAESLVRTVKRDYAWIVLHPAAGAVTQQLADWLKHYNTKHPHNALDYLASRRIREKKGGLTNAGGTGM